MPQPMVSLPTLLISLPMPMVSLPADADRQLADAHAQLADAHGRSLMRMDSVHLFFVPSPLARVPEKMLAQR